MSSPPLRLSRRSPQPFPLSRGQVVNPVRFAHAANICGGPCGSTRLGGGGGFTSSRSPPPPKKKSTPRAWVWFDIFIFFSLNKSVQVAGCEGRKAEWKGPDSARLPQGREGEHGGPGVPGGTASAFLGEFLVFWKPEAAWKRWLRGRDLDGRGEERRRGRAPKAATKGRALPQGSSGFAFGIGLRYKSRLPGIFGDPQDPSGAREAGGPGQPCSDSAQRGSESAERLLEFIDFWRCFKPTTQPGHPPGMARHGTAQHGGHRGSFGAGEEIRMDAQGEKGILAS